MRESIAELFRVLEPAVPAARAAAEASNWEMVEELVRQILSAGSKLHTRAKILSELAEDAKFVAEVDRAVNRAKAGRVLPIPGDVPLPFPPTEERASAPRKGRQTPKKG